MTTITYLPNVILSAITLLAFVLTQFVFLSALEPLRARADENTVDLVMEKKFSGPVPSGYAESQFSFDITGPAIDQNIPVTSVDAGFYGAPVTLPAGVYTIREQGPQGFVPGDWRVQWSGECTESPSDNLEAILVVDSGNIGDGVQPCRADNQWRPSQLVVTKHVVGTSTPPQTFTFMVTQGSSEVFDGAFESDGQNEILIGSGAYAVTEDAAANFTTTYSAGCSGELTATGGTNVFCDITNTYVPDVPADTGTIVIEKQTIPDGDLSTFTFDPSWSVSNFTLRDGEQSTTTALAAGTYSITESLSLGWTPTSALCSDGSPVTAIALSGGETVTCVFTSTFATVTGLVFGFVWNDANNNDFWDTEVDIESDLDGWVVSITDGETTLATTTNTDGYYEFQVSPGTWTITEQLQTGWQQTFPNLSSHVVVVTGAITERGTQGVFATLLDLVLPTAYAQSITSYGPFNFGNLFPSSGGGATSNGGGGGDGGGGNGKKISLTSGGRSNNDDAFVGGRGGGSGEPGSTGDSGEVLGESTSVIPAGAPNTGAGGAAPAEPVLPALKACLLQERARDSKNVKIT